MRSWFKKSLQFFLVFTILIGWIFSGWPQIRNFPPKTQKVYATTISPFANSNAVDGSLGEWTNPTYAYNDDGVQFATRTGTVKNTWYGNLFGFDLNSYLRKALDKRVMRLFLAQFALVKLV